MQNHAFRTEWLGMTPYGVASTSQLARHQEVLAGADGSLLGLEHPTVITLGVRGKAAVDLLDVSAGIEVFPTDRGGQATLHSPGQLVIYPILPWRRWGISPKCCVHLLLETTVDLLREHGVKAFISPEGTGIYTSQGKIAFCGLRLQQGVSRHGLSLNLSNDLTLFKSIRPCGSASEHLTSWAKEVGQTPDSKIVFQEWAAHLRTRLAQRVVPCEADGFRAL